MRMPVVHARSARSPRRRFGLFAVVLGVLFSTTAWPASPAAAATSIYDFYCATQSQRLAEVDAKIVEHNEQTGRSGAAVAAEADRLNAQRSLLQAAQVACIDAIAQLRGLDADTGLPIPRTKLADIANAARSIPAGWQPPKSPDSKGKWTVPDKMRALYEVLRGLSPPRMRNSLLQGTPRPKVGDVDPAFPAHTIQPLSGHASVSDVKVDHIVPLTQLMQMDNFLALPPAYMYAVVNSPLNMQWLSEEANRKKSSGAAGDIPDADDGWKAKQEELADHLTTRMQDLIHQLYDSLYPGHGGDPVAATGGAPPPGPVPAAAFVAPGSAERAATAAPATAPGGIDFSTLQLQYLSDNGAGVQYAFHAGTLTSGSKPSTDGAAATKLASDAFFVWLELPANVLTVNLNPDQPDNIINAQLGRTDVGRVMLQADLQLKRIVATFINPDTTLGKQYWQALGATTCVSERQWIVPAPATVHEDGDQLYILKAPLQVKMESDYGPAAGGTGSCPGQSTAELRHNEDIYRQLILPKVQHEVDTGHDFADLRRVYASRIAAEWYRQRSATTHTSYGDLVGQDDVSRWVSQQGWSPQDIYQLYLQSYHKGEFDLWRTTQHGNMVTTHHYIYGGIDFSLLHLAQLGAAVFDTTYADLPDTIGDAVVAPHQEPDGVWLGGATVPVATDGPPPPPGPTHHPLFIAAVTAPVLVWLLAGLILLRRRWPTHA
jgi:hypothetical protein